MLTYEEMRVRRIAELSGEIAVLARVDEKPVDGIGLSAAEIKNYSVSRALREMEDMARKKQPRPLPGLEGAVHRALVEKYGQPESALAFLVPWETLYRSLSAATASAGGYLVGTTSGGSYIEMLRNRSAAFRLGAQLLPGQVANLTIPRLSGSASAAWLPTESTTASPTQQTLQQVAASPKTVAGYTELSRQLVLQSNPSAEQVIMTDLAAVVGVALDLAVVNGSGTDQPLGILNTAGVGTFSGTTLGLDGLSEAQSDILDSNALLNPATLGYCTTPAIAKLLKNRQRFTGTDSPLWAGPLHDGNIEGVRAISSKQIPSASMIYGDFSQILIPEWGTLAIEVNRYANFQAGIIGIRAMLTADVVVRHPASFSVATSIT